MPENPDLLAVYLEQVRQRSELPLGPSAAALAISNEATQRLLNSAADVPVLLRIVMAAADAHYKVLDVGDGYCATCMRIWPCETYKAMVRELPRQEGRS